MMSLRPVAISLAPCLLASLQALAAVPPDLPGFTCTVASVSVDDGLRLELTLRNESAGEISLTPGPHLVLFRDPSASNAMGITVRVDRVQNVPLVVPAQSSRTVLYSVASGLTEELRCNGVQPAAAGLYFYQYNHRPQFKCLLQGFRPEVLTMNPTCPSGPSLGKESR